MKFKIWLIKKLGGYTKEELLTKNALSLYNSIQAEDILKEISPTEWRYMGKTIRPDQRSSLISEATIFKESKLWEILQNDIKYHSNLKMFSKSQSFDDLVAGKLWLLTLDAMNTRLNSLKRGKGTFNS